MTLWKIALSCKRLSVLATVVMKDTTATNFLFPAAHALCKGLASLVTSQQDLGARAAQEYGNQRGAGYLATQHALVKIESQGESDRPFSSRVAVESVGEGVAEEA